MAEATYVYSALETVTCDSCRNLAAGDQVDIHLRQDLLPALPESVRGVVQLVDGLDYTLQYETDDLLGVIPAITDEFVEDVVCVTELQLAREYSDAKDAEQDILITNLFSALAGLGVVPVDGDTQFVVHSGSVPGVSVESVKHDKVEIIAGGNDNLILDPEDLASPLGIADLTDLGYRIEVSVSAISSKINDSRDSVASFVLVGQFDKGATVHTENKLEVDGVTLTAVKVGNNLHITCTNSSSGDIDMFVTSKFRILS